MKRLLDSLLEQTYKNFEIVLVAQDNFDHMQKICSMYNSMLEIVLVKNNIKGLSKARNKGMSFCTGDIIVLSDDDCWYPLNAAEEIVEAFSEDNISVLLTKIYDLDNDREYKTYKTEIQDIKSSFTLLSKSSIEIAFKKNCKNVQFDEQFGVGAHFVCCEEVDFLINLYRRNHHIRYKPIVTVYHEKKYSGSTRNQVIAKGAIYSKNYNYVIGLLICIKDLIFRHEMNFAAFFEGYNEYKSFKRRR